MKRTAEITLSIIGSVLYLIGALFGGIFRMFEGNEELREEIMNDPQVQQTDIGDVQLILDTMGSFGTVIVVSSIIAIVVGIVASILFKGNNKPVIASILLLVTSVVIIFITYGLGIFAGIFFIIAGIMGLARKPKQEVNMEQY
ncbi:DUF4064 domain-containing protein [Gracilibacillus sp. S3-1-1]|uniref:DUF4064 domain-containing protein n=1 Tax=Gracilibacillus pellucidus TaxID=3095368 RepID=A0ACC6M5T6_9BACI|nr:DUF4064 domain-containing protein [Gracilibacillus sp. S3-1-1]MDX8046348.1 DUF4064 domain-containing protein [Gracilibacillus sp. S3-1-1]